VKIAIVAPSPVPFTIGGAENLAWGLLDALQQRTTHRADLIKLPSRELGFWDLLDSYRAFAALDLSHFDLVISTKYPAWMVQHDNHVCYLLHRLRGLYDAYHYFRLPERVSSAHPIVRDLQQLMLGNAGRREVLPQLFAHLDALRAVPDLPPDLLQFPGPLIREVVHFLDGVALAPGRIRKYAAISETVAARKDYFPAGVPVEVLYPPSHLKDFRTGAAHYLFTVSRLDGAKRASLLVDAMAHVKSNIELRIAGTGPDEARLKEIAARDARIKLLGFVKDSEVLDLYADSLAVLFVPLDEDYGLVTVEAMMSGKPVLTTTDSGGPTELVEDGVTGFCVPPDPSALAEKIDQLCDNRAHARSMGAMARRRAQKIGWDAVVGRLLAADTAISKPTAKSRPRRKRITVAVTFPIHPPRGGGQSRIFYLYRQLAEHAEIELVTVAGTDAQASTTEIAPGLWETRVPKSSEHGQAEWQLEQEAKVVVTDVAMPRLYRKTPDYLRALRRSADKADVLIASHPYLFPALREVSGKPIWYEAHNCEWELKRSFFPETRVARDLLAEVRELEQACCADSQLVMTCSSEDSASLAQLYGVPPLRLLEVPNGVDLDTVRFASLEARTAAKSRLDLSRDPIAVFMGSWHGPNLDAVRHLFRIAAKAPRVNFLVIGSSCLAFKDKPRPTNVALLGVVDDAEKDTILGLADMALNPCVSGSGTNLKMLDYFASGVPVISTAHGVRGLSVKHEEHVLLAEPDQFPEVIGQLQREAPAVQQARVESARRLAEGKFAWPVIASNFWLAASERGLV